MATMENLSHSLGSLNGIVAAMQVDMQQKTYDLQVLQAQIAAMATGQELQAIKDAQAALNQASDEKRALGQPNFDAMEVKVVDLAARIDQLEIRGTGPLSSAPGGKGHGAIRIHRQR